MKKTKRFCAIALALFLTSTTIISCEGNEETGDSVICDDVGLECSKSPYSFKACADSNGNVWWELNGTKYNDVITATEAYENYCN